MVEGGSGEARHRRGEGGGAKEEVEEAEAGDHGLFKAAANAKDDGIFSDC